MGKKRHSIPSNLPALDKGSHRSAHAAMGEALADHPDHRCRASSSSTRMRTRSCRGLSVTAPQVCAKLLPGGCPGKKMTAPHFSVFFGGTKTAEPEQVVRNVPAGLPDNGVAGHPLKSNLVKKGVSNRSPRQARRKGRAAGAADECRTRVCISAGACRIDTTQRFERLSVWDSSGSSYRDRSRHNEK